MRLLRLAFAYDDYLTNIYRSSSRLASLPHALQMATFNRDCFPGASNAMTVELSELGYEVEDHVINARPSQMMWAKEHGLDVRDASWMMEVATAQVKNFAPEILLINPYVMPPSWISEIRQVVTSLKAIVGRFSSPATSLSTFSSCDLVTSGDPEQVEALRAAGIRSAHLHHAFDQRILARTIETDRKDEVFFAGQLNLAEGFHNYRAVVLQRLIESGVPLRVHVLSPDLTLAGRAKSHARRFLWRAVTSGPNWLRSLWKHIPVADGVAAWNEAPPKILPSRFRRVAHSPLFGLALYQAMRSTSVVLNIHGDVSAHYANNLRMWETTGVGTCLLADEKANLRSIFGEEEVVSFASPEDCLEKAEWLVSHPKEARAIGAAGQKRTLAEHTYSERAKEFDALLRGVI